MKNYDQSVNINCDPNWPFIRDYPYRILTLIFGPSPSPPPLHPLYWFSLNNSEKL